MNIDIRTLLVAHALQNLVLTAIMGLAAVQNRGRMRGPTTWFVGNLCYDAGLVFLSLRGFLPTFVSYEIATGLMYAGALMVPMGTAKFFGAKPLLKTGIAAIAGSIAVYSFFVRIMPDTSVRIILFAAFVGAAYLAAAVRAWHHSRFELARPALVAAAMYVLAGAASIVRIVLYLSFSRGTDLFQAGSIDAVYFLFSLVVLPGVTFAQLQLINGRLLAQLAAAASERGLLLREMNHRVKNSLALAESLVSLQGSKMADSAGAQAMADVRLRLHSIALVHERLNRVDAGSRIRADDYLADLIADIAATAPRFSVRTDLAPMEIDAGTAVSLGIVVNELLTNSVKYAAAPDGSGSADVRLEESGGLIKLRVSDAGPGFPNGMAAGLGTELVDALASQLRGTVRRWNDGGSVAELGFPPAKTPS